MSEFNPREYDPVRCGNCREYLEGNRDQIKCGHPGCTEYGCELCFKECQASKACGRMCEVHLVEVEDLGPCCLRCTAEEIPEDLVA